MWLPKPGKPGKPYEFVQSATSFLAAVDSGVLLEFGVQRKKSVVEPPVLSITETE